MLKHRHSSTLFLLQRGMELLGALRVSWDFVGSHLQKAHLGAQFGVVNGYTASASWDITPLAYVSYTYVSTCKHLIYIYNWTCTPLPGPQNIPGRRNMMRSGYKIPTEMDFQSERALYNILEPRTGLDTWPGPAMNDPKVHGILKQNVALTCIWSLFARSNRS